MHKFSALFLSSVLGLSSSTTLMAAQKSDWNLQPTGAFLPQAKKEPAEVFGPYLQPLTAKEQKAKLKEAALEALQEQTAPSQVLAASGQPAIEAIWVELPAQQNCSGEMRIGYSTQFKEDPAALSDEADNEEIQALLARVQAIQAQLATSAASSQADPEPGQPGTPASPKENPEDKTGPALAPDLSASGDSNTKTEDEEESQNQAKAELPAQDESEAQSAASKQPERLIEAKTSGAANENPDPASQKSDARDQLETRQASLMESLSQLEQKLSLLASQKAAVQTELDSLSTLASDPSPATASSQQAIDLSAADPLSEPNEVNSALQDEAEIHEQKTLDQTTQTVNDSVSSSENTANTALPAEIPAVSSVDPAVQSQLENQRAALESQIQEITGQIEQTQAELQAVQETLASQPAPSNPENPASAVSDSSLVSNTLTDNGPVSLASKETPAPEDQTAPLAKDEAALSNAPAQLLETTAGAPQSAPQKTSSPQNPLDQEPLQHELASLEPVQVESGLMPGNTPNLHQIKEQLAQIEQAIHSGNTDPALAKQASSLGQTLQAMETVSVYRLYNPNSGEHFYTPSAQEKDHLVQAGWNFEGTGWRAPKNDPSTPVYRLYNPNAGDHHYTTDVQEKTYLASVGWNDEGVAWYSDPWQGVEIFRAYNPNARVGAHHFTSNSLERDALVKAGWRNEAVGFYARFMYSLCPDPSTGQTIWYDENDQKLAGDQQINGYWYYFNPDGTAQTGLYTSSQTGQTRLYGADGRHMGGTQTIDGRRYYFDSSSGLMSKNKLVTNNDGTLTYYGADGAVATGTFTVANAVFTADANGNILSTTLNNVPHFRQDDPAWAYTTINGVSFRSSGCAPTVLASAISALSGSNVSPYTIGVMLGNAGYMNSGFLGTSGNGIVYAANTYGIPVRGSLSQAQAAAILRAGGVVTAAVGPGTFCPVGYTHELLVYGYQNGHVYIHDPLGMGADGWYPLSLIFDQRSYDRDDCAGGGPAFALSNTRLPW